MAGINLPTDMSRRAAYKDEAACRCPDRDEQFQHIARLRAHYERQGWSIISIDTKKKEILGNFYHPGRALTDGRVIVQDHDFVTAERRLVPYGVYDVQRNEALILPTKPYMPRHKGKVSAEVNFLGERTSFTYDGASRRTLTEQGKGTRTSVVYDAADRIVNQWNLKSDGSVLVGLDYESDPVGNRMRMREAKRLAAGWNDDYLAEVLFGS